MYTLITQGPAADQAAISNLCLLAVANIVSGEVFKAWMLHSITAAAGTSFVAAAECISTHLIGSPKYQKHMDAREP